MDPTLDNIRPLQQKLQTITTFDNKSSFQKHTQNVQVYITYLCFFVIYSYHEMCSGLWREFYFNTWWKR